MSHEYAHAGHGDPETAPGTYDNGYANGSYGYYAASEPGDQQPTPQTRTLVLRGFPMDVKDRECNNLLRFLPGYQASMLSWDEREVKGHALFASSALAHAARQRIDGQVEFDSGFLLRADMASEDLRVEDPLQGKRASPEESAHTPPGPGATPAPQAGGIPPAPAYLATGPAGVLPYPTGPYGYAPTAVAVGPPPPALATPPRTYAPVKNDKDNPPCNTLFIGNLGEGVDENELRAVFGPLPGFQQVKVVHGPRGVSAFIEFVDVATAAACHQTQQGMLLATSDRGPIRLQYSKNPFGRKRDAVGNGMAGAAGGGGLPGMGYAAYALPMQQALMQPGYATAQGVMYGA